MISPTTRFAMVLPVTVPIDRWFEEWGAVVTHGGSLKPEVIPEGVLWMDANHVILESPAGRFIQPIGDFKEILAKDTYTSILTKPGGVNILVRNQP